MQPPALRTALAIALVKSKKESYGEVQRLRAERESLTQRVALLEEELCKLRAVPCETISTAEVLLMQSSGPWLTPSGATTGAQPLLQQMCLVHFARACGGANLLSAQSATTAVGYVLLCLRDGAALADAVGQHYLQSALLCLQDCCRSDQGLPEECLLCLQELVTGLVESLSAQAYDTAQGSQDSCLDSSSRSSQSRPSLAMQVVKLVRGLIHMQGANCETVLQVLQAMLQEAATGLSLFRAAAAILCGLTAGMAGQFAQEDHAMAPGVCERGFLLLTMLQACTARLPNWLHELDEAQLSPRPHLMEACLDDVLAAFKVSKHLAQELPLFVDATARTAAGVVTAVEALAGSDCMHDPLMLEGKEMPMKLWEESAALGASALLAALI